MSVMLATIFLYAVMGLFVRRLGAREHVLVAVMASAMTLIYVLFANKVL